MDRYRDQVWETLANMLRNCYRPLVIAIDVRVLLWSDCFCPHAWLSSTSLRLDHPLPTCLPTYLWPALVSPARINLPTFFFGPRCASTLAIQTAPCLCPGNSTCLLTLDSIPSVPRLIGLASIQWFCSATADSSEYCSNPDSHSMAAPAAPPDTCDYY